ncbi:hypothetical protein BJAB07104_p0025 (plasmid) [Acinetobacter baumannii BJAB07104]|uniref:Uncharacterized protein n=1 Tax=Acinetobacter baumannii TaxID=470 RepID=A0A0C4Y4H6_ACIBA|nr:hypothetical protein BJAB0868_p0035 [Acinetobacter baumannii BJAB0868]AGQ16153.1 hypothetical protein BJAB07104_p0025 [Acinetobacter baumannii BJAB07104]AJF79865.1 hypothetical protein NG19_0029 [Acinetobacter baumannii]KJG90485.1 hypothetical protein QU96_3847 [Acinetobacter baumannii]QZX59208.1 hypothetical protein [Acinetobacter baumannii]
MAYGVYMKSQINENTYILIVELSNILKIKQGFNYENN